MNKPFTYMFSEPNLSACSVSMLVFCVFTAVFGLGAIATIALQNNPIALMFGIIAAIVFLLFGICWGGYQISCIQANIKSPEDTITTIKSEDLGKGFKFFIAQFIFNVVAGLVCLIPIAGLIISFILLIMMPALVRNFAETEEILALLKWSKAFQLIKENSNQYFKSIFYFILLGIINAVILAIFFIAGGILVAANPSSAMTVTGITCVTIIIFILAIYDFFVSVNIIANCIKKQTC